MSSSSLVCLAILPLIVWASLAFVARSTSKTASNLRTAWRAKTKKELAEGARSWAVHGFITFSAVLGSLLLWNRAKAAPFLTILNPSHWKDSLFHGTVWGLVLIGILLMFRNYFPQTQKFGLLVMSGVASPLLVRSSALLLAVFAEEAWRALSLNALTADGIQGPLALIATSIAYGLTYLAWGTPAAISEGLVGAAFGGLFLWSGSFFVPLAAHVTLQAQVLLYAVAAAPDAEVGDIQRRPYTHCPSCGAVLTLRQVNLNINEAFFCPSCHTRVTVSDRRRAFLRWGTASISVPLWVAALHTLPGGLNGARNYWVLLAMMISSASGLWSILQVVFPPALQCGDADFISLNLGDQNAGRTTEEKASGPDDKRDST